MDWTDFARDGQATIMISMVTRLGRATPLVWRKVRKDRLKEQRKAAQWVGNGGRVRTLRTATITMDNTAVNTIVCVHER